MKGIINFFGGPMMFLIIGVLIAILVAAIIFTVDPDPLLNIFKGFSP